MAPTTAGQVESAALQKRVALTGAKTGPLALFNNLKVFGIACFACLGGLLYGYNQGVFSGVLVMHSFQERMYPSGRHFERSRKLIVVSDMGDYVDNKTKMGWLSSILELGAWFGALTSGFSAEALSRKYAILVYVAVFIIGVVVQATAITGTGHSSILGGRFVTGMGVGALSTIVPMVSSEENSLEICVVDRSYRVQRRDRPTRSSWCACRTAAVIHYARNYDLLLD